MKSNDFWVLSFQNAVPKGSYTEILGRISHLEAVSKLRRRVLKLGKSGESEASAIPGGFDVDRQDPGGA
jgi:hypothetical protein